MESSTALMANVTDDCPAGMVTLAGTVSSEVSPLVSVTVRADDRLALLRETVPDCCIGSCVFSEAGLIDRERQSQDIVIGDAESRRAGRVTGCCGGEQHRLRSIDHCIINSGNGEGCRSLSSRDRHSRWNSSLGCISAGQRHSPKQKTDLRSASRYQSKHWPPPLQRPTWG